MRSASITCALGDEVQHGEAFTESSPVMGVSMISPEGLAIRPRIRKLADLLFGTTAPESAMT